MKRNKWSSEEIKFLEDNAHKKTVSEMSKMLQRTEKAIRGRLEKINLSLRTVKNIDHREWTNEEDEFLKNFYHKLTVKEMEDVLSRTEKAIRSRKNKLKLNNKYEKIQEDGGKVYYRNSKEYQLYYDKKTNKLTALHRKLYEAHHNIKLKKEQKIHHIDGDKKNNDINNLFLCNSVSEHRLLHSQLEDIAYLLTRENFILFDHENGKYIANPNRRLGKA